jgi:hypothetical protein
MKVSEKQESQSQEINVVELIHLCFLCVRPVYIQRLYYKIGTTSNTIADRSTFVETIDSTWHWRYKLESILVAVSSRLVDF